MITPITLASYLILVHLTKWVKFPAFHGGHTLNGGSLLHNLGWDHDDIIVDVMTLGRIC